MKNLLLLLTLLSWSAWAETPSDATDTQIDKLSNNCPTGWDPTNLTKIKNCMAVNHEDRIDTLEAEFSAITLDGWRELTGAPVRIRTENHGSITLYTWHNDHWDDTLGRHTDKDWLSPDFRRNRKYDELDKRKIKYTWIGAAAGLDEFPEIGPYDQRVYYTTTDCTAVGGEYLDNNKIGINHGWPVFQLPIDGIFGTYAMDLITSEVQLGPIEGSSRVEFFWDNRRPAWYDGAGECVPTTLDGTYWSIDIWEPMVGNVYTDAWWVDY